MSHDISSKQIVDYLGETLQLLVAGGCLTVMVLIANLKVSIVNWNIKILQMFHERRVHELKAFWREKWTIHIHVPKFLLVVI